MIKIKINRFDNIVNDPRDTSFGSCRAVTNFDVFTSPNKLIPYISSEDGNSNSANDEMRNWTVARLSAGTYKLYGLGRQTAVNKVRIFYKNIATGGLNDLDDNSWTETANTLGTQTTPNYSVFVYYATTGLIYGAHNGYIYTYDPSGSAAFGDTAQALTYTNIAQGLVHSKKDILYIPYDNKILQNNAGSYDINVFQIPSSYYITVISEFGNYLAVAAAPLSGIGNSKIFIWDLIADAEPYETFEAGSGVVKVMAELNGRLTWVSIESSLSGGSFYYEKIHFRYYDGVGARTYDTLVDTTGTPQLPQTQQKINNRLHFMMKINLNGVSREGVWSIGENKDGKFTLIHERTHNNDTALSTGTLHNFFYVGSFLFQAFTTSGGTSTVTKTLASATYTATSIYESAVNPGMSEMDKQKKKQLCGIKVRYTALPAAGQVVVKYKVDSATSSFASAGTTIYTETTDNSIYTEYVSAGSNQFTAGYEYEFRFESTGGAEILDYTYSYESLPTNV